MTTVNLLKKLSMATAGAAFAILGATVAATPAYAGSLYWNFNFALNNGDTATGQFVTQDTPSSGNQYLITGLTGTQTGSVNGNMSLITGGPGTFLSPSGQFMGNNLLNFPASPTYFDSYGLLYSVAGEEWNLWGNNDGSYADWAFSPSRCGWYCGNNVTSLNVTPVATPEPASILGVMTLGLLGVTALKRKENQKNLKALLFR